MAAAPSRVLGVACGPEQASYADRLLLAALAAFARAGAQALLVAPDPVSGRVLASLGTPPPPVPAGVAAVELPAAHAAVPLVAAWPSYAAPALAAARADLDAAREDAVRSWRARTSATAYALHRADPLDLVLAVPSTASTASALLLAHELDVPVVALVGISDVRSGEDMLLAGIAHEVVTVDDEAGLVADAARILREVAP